MGRWTAFKPQGHFNFDAKSVKRQWAKLHAADCEPLPDDTDLLEAWAHFHNGHFEEACLLGLALGDEGVTVANKAACIYASQLEPRAVQRLTLYQSVSERAANHLQRQPNNPNTHYLLAASLSGYSQGISVTQALAQGIGGRIKAALETTIALQPQHADAHFALGAFHADIIDKVGMLIANMTLGARRDASLEMFERGFALYPRSAFGLTEYATALQVLEGESHAAQCAALLKEAAALKPLDAQHYLEIASAKNNRGS